VHLVGAPIHWRWRMATRCLNDLSTAFQRLEQDYIASTMSYSLDKDPPQTLSKFGA
jgi:hypothetical protein